MYKYRLNRDKFESIFLDFLKKINCDRYGWHGNDFGYANDVFWVRPYNFNAECDCGFDEKEDEFHSTHKHDDNCACRALKISKSNYYFKCDCGFDEKEDKFYQENHHAQDCMVMQPNFWYKPSDLKIQWYKYPLRSAYSNKKINVKYLMKILEHCVDSYQNLFKK